MFNNLKTVIYYSWSTITITITKSLLTCSKGKQRQPNGYTQKVRSSCVRCWGNTSVLNMTLIRLKSTNLISFDVSQYDYTVKPVLRGHICDKEKVVF